jgi:hypothetical protein
MRFGHLFTFMILTVVLTASSTFAFVPSLALAQGHPPSWPMLLAFTLPASLSIPQLIIVLAPFIPFAAALAWLTNEIRLHVKNARLAKALQVVASLAFTIVSRISQTVVADLKDPSKPGSWNTTVAAAAKRQALDDLRAVGASVIPQLMSGGIKGAALDTLLESHVESAVLALKSPSIAGIAPQSLVPVTQS